MPELEQLDQTAIDTIRALSMDAVQAARSGHPGTPMALAPLGWAIYSRLLRHDPAHPDWPDRDRFVLSCGHASMLQYALLYLSGYPISLDDIRKFRQWNSLTPGHPEFGHTVGVETTTGPLGQGLANAVGMAMAERQLSMRFNRPDLELVDHHTWVIASDGDLMEGVCAEAASLAGHLRLSKLVVFWDDNRITIDGSTDICFTEDVLRRFESYGFRVDSVEDGNDIGAIVAAGNAARESDRPSFIRVRTVIGYPAPNKQGTPGAHGAPLGADEIRRTRDVMGWPQEDFHVPPAVESATEVIRAAGRTGYRGWKDRLQSYREAHPDDATNFERAMNDQFPSIEDGELPVFDVDEKGMATRKASGEVLRKLMFSIPELVGGSADLAGSNNVAFKGLPAFSAPGEASEHAAASEDERAPRTIAFGIREHAMAASVNGMALHGGVMPFCATFLVFSDYMRPALRLAAMMGLRARYVFTHDSIGLGEDGPTHQPVEHLAALRLIPGFTVFRPADANETRACWQAAIACDGPAAMVLTRQSVPVFDRSRLAAADGAKRGAYVLAEAPLDQKNAAQAREVILIGTGSEVQIALEAREMLLAEGVRARVVSMPSWELFEQQDQAYRDEVLPPDIDARVVVEAARGFGWERWVGARGKMVTMERFGASAPYDQLYQELGITAQRVAAAARSFL